MMPWLMMTNGTRPRPLTSPESSTTTTRHRRTSTKDLENEEKSSSSKSMQATRRRWLSLSSSPRTAYSYIFFILLFILLIKTGIYVCNTDVSSIQLMLPKTSIVSSIFREHQEPESEEHPIPNLMDDAERRFKEKVDRQSKTLKEAVAEYQRRYQRLPPKGFDDWWEFAKENNVVMVDEYDGLMRDLEPFYQFSGEEIRRRTAQVGTLPSINIVRVRRGKARIVNLSQDFKDSELSARAQGFKNMLKKFVHKLPNVDFPINTKAEGRVVIPWEHQKYPELAPKDSDRGIQHILGGPFIADWRGDGNVWEEWRRTCEPCSIARRLFSSIRDVFAEPPQTHFSSSSHRPPDFVFANATSFSTLDFCQNPHAHYTQGHFFSDWRTIGALYPVFSPAKAKGFMDIKIPSHYYWGSTKGYTYGWDPVKGKLSEVDVHEVPWEDKIDKMFWRGATTGGGSTPPGFAAQYQRHRLVRMASKDKDSNEMKTIVYANASSDSREKYVSRGVPIGDLNSEIMDVAFVKATNLATYPGGWKALRKSHRFGDSVPLGRHWSYRYLLDVDGMGYSGRFMAFLASDSVPVKNTVYEEFFSDWIEPWVHFIPLSTSYKEIYNIYAYYSGLPPSLRNSTTSLQSTDAGNRLKRIATSGKRWKKTIGRPEDMEAYVYRLALEYARLFTNDREAMTYDIKE
ncbi:hypothetical protein E1B28_006766 [Marasmius oreades]|uniref:Glycosyl transferase CAP10 domain-containing protein n=1 Tax=Marasmius oreades TaxID=181124 RepID=A0A9P8ABE3_9AGAR|nr:uncharacterized protein E1B28_006766 [Marasmius oreades]KAG7096090.1 hypothetical protein E1B28_006766 [Marasmius oreades]